MDYKDFILRKWVLNFHSLLHIYFQSLSKILLCFLLNGYLSIKESSNSLKRTFYKYQTPTTLDRRMDQIVIIKKLTDYPRRKPCPQATWIFWDNIIDVVYGNLIEKAINSLRELVYQRPQSPSMEDNQNILEMGRVMGFSIVVHIFFPLELQQLFNKKERLCSNLIALSMVFLLAHRLNEMIKFGLGVFQLHECS
jgi:hypothetical protein